MRPEKSERKSVLEGLEWSLGVVETQVESDRGGGGRLGGGGGGGAGRGWTVRVVEKGGRDRSDYRLIQYVKSLLRKSWRTMSSSAGCFAPSCIPYPLCPAHPTSSSSCGVSSRSFSSCASSTSSPSCSCCCRCCCRRYSRPQVKTLVVNPQVEVLERPGPGASLSHLSNCSGKWTPSLSPTWAQT